MGKVFLTDNKIRNDKLKGIDIEKEYELVQEKKSNLSKSLRDLVVSRYKMMQLKKVEPIVEEVKEEAVETTNVIEEQPNG